jgi:hypothetical protein
VDPNVACGNRQILCGCSHALENAKAQQADLKEAGNTKTDESGDSHAVGSSKAM